MGGCGLVEWDSASRTRHRQIVDDVKTDDLRKTLTISDDLLDVLKAWKQTTQFSAPEDWIFASPFQIGRLPYSYTGVQQE
jgi:hypothetical protein